MIALFQSRIFFLLIFWSIGFFIFPKVGCVAKEDAQSTPESWNKENLKPYLLPRDHPLSGKLKNFFRNPRTFDSIVSLRAEGFTIIKRGCRCIVVARHKLFPKYIFKFYSKSCSSPPSLNVQVSNLMRRILGAEKVRSYIKENHFEHLAVPKKWLYRLPSIFSEKDERKYLLIVEEFDIYNVEQTTQKYAQLSKKAVKELCLTLQAIGGCDAYPRNQPIMRSGQIAFVDTEDVGRYRYNFVRHIVPLLERNLQTYALALWEELETDYWRKKELEAEEIRLREEAAKNESPTPTPPPPPFPAPPDPAPEPENPSL